MPLHPILILDNIRSTHNVGAIFRTADAAGVGFIYLVGYTPAPIDRFGKLRPDITKASLGAEQTVQWKSILRAGPTIESLKEKGYLVIALEQTPHSVDYRKAIQKGNKKPIALIVGNEVDGVSSSLLKKSDIAIEIPMRGKKESLNVSVATGIALYELIQK